MQLGPDRCPVIGPISPSAPSPLFFHTQINHVTLEFMARAILNKRTTYRLSGIKKALLHGLLIILLGGYVMYNTKFV